MLLAEALQRRAEVQQIIGELSGRVTANARYQEGDDGPSLDPNAMIDEIEGLSRELTDLVTAINHTNAGTIDNGDTITSLIANRDRLRSARKLTLAFAAAVGRDRHRFGREEIRWIAVLDGAELFAKADIQRGELRDLDARIQRLNWTTELTPYPPGT